MTTFLPTLLVLLLIAAPAWAEPPEEDILRPRIPTGGRFFVGFDVGLNTTWFDGNPIYRAFFASEEESEFFRSGFGFEPFGGLYVGMNVSPNLSVRLRGDYDVRVADRNGTSVDSCPLIDAVTRERIGTVPVQVDKEYSLEMRYLTFSLAGEYRIGRAFVWLGPAFSLPIGRTFRETDRILDPNSICIYFGETADTTREIFAEATGVGNVRAVFAVKLGVGYEIDMGAAVDLITQIGLDLPLTTALEEDEPYAFRSTAPGATESITTRLNRHMYFRAIQASVGLRYSF